MRRDEHPAMRERPWTRRRLRLALLSAVAECGLEHDGFEDDSDALFWVQRTVGSAARRGEFSSNIALALAARVGIAPRELAQRLAPRAAACLGWTGDVTAANGFLNFGMNDEFLHSQIGRAMEGGERWGAGAALAATRILVEFVSAEPNGPLPLGAARIAALGDALCRILALQGADVTREFYLNDDASNSKMRLLGESVAAHYGAAFGHDIEPPEGALDDAFVRGVAAGIARDEGDIHLRLPENERTAAFARRALQAAVARQKQTLHDFGVNFDVWTSEQALRDEGRVEATLNTLRERGHLFERDGAQWLRTSAFGDEADRPLLRPTPDAPAGKPTYLASDIAYHAFKMERGFDRIINIWTVEHRAYVGRTHAALRAAGCDAERVEVVLCEGVRWLRDGTPVQRGRDGGAFTLDEALAELDRDTLRFWLLLRDWDAVAQVDDELASRDDEINPAYAARLVPARLSTMLGELEARAASESASETANVGSATPLWSEEERNLARLVALWPDTVETAALRREPQRVAHFLSAIAATVRALLAASRPDSANASAGAAAQAEEGPQRTQSQKAKLEARIELLCAARVTAVNALRALGMEAGANL